MGGHRGHVSPQKIAAPYIFKAASLIRTIHVHPECPPNQIMFLHQCVFLVPYYYKFLRGLYFCEFCE